MKHHTLARCHPALVLAAMLVSAGVYADDAAPAGTAPASAPAPSKHQLMKDCMAKQKAAESGRPKYELTQDCKDITKSEKQNADADKKQADKAAADKPAQPAGP